MPRAALPTKPLELKLPRTLDARIVGVAVTPTLEDAARRGAAGTAIHRAPADRRDTCNTGTSAAPTRAADVGAHPARNALENMTATREEEKGNSQGAKLPL